MRTNNHLPDCMLPDGAEPCIGYQSVNRQLEAMTADNARLRAEHEVLRVRAEEARELSCSWAERVLTLDEARMRSQLLFSEVVEVLEFYRDQWDWRKVGDGMAMFVPSCELLGDCGELARDTLTKIMCELDEGKTKQLG